MDDETADRARRARHGSPYLTADQAAHFLGTSRRSLQRWKALGKGPVCRLHGGTVQYHIDDLVAWSEGREEGKRP